MIIPLMIDIRNAPKHIIEEIDAIGEEFNLDKLSDEAKEWIDNNSENFIDVVLSNAKRLYEGIEFHTATISTIHKAIPKEKADEINDNLYDACAKFVREYNKAKL